MSQVPVQWGVHEDVFCAVRTHCSMLLMSSCLVQHKRLNTLLQPYPVLSCGDLSVVNSY